MLKFLTNILQIIVNPTRGWEDVSGSNDEPQQLCRDGFYPLLGIAALSCAAMFWRIGLHTTLLNVIQMAIVTFTSYFVTFFFACFALSMAIPKISEKEMSLKRNATLVIYSLSIMVIIAILINIVPIDFPVLNFLPVYVGVILYKAIPYMGIKQDYVGHYMFLTIFSIMVPPYLLEFLFKILLPY